MSDALQLFALVGSARTGSVNQQLAQAAAASAERCQAQVQIPDLRALDLPLFDQDLEAAQGIPAGARQVREQLRASAALIVCTPEYNGFPTPLLKNTIDWMSRPDGDVPGLVAFRGKPVLVLSASPGRLGGLRSLAVTRQLMGNLGMILMPEKLSLGGARQGFDETGQLRDEAMRQTLDQAIAALCQRARQLSG